MNHSSIACRSEPKKTSLHGISRTAVQQIVARLVPLAHELHRGYDAARCSRRCRCKGRCRFHHLLMQQRLAAVHCHQSRTVGNARMRPFELANLFAESFETLPLYSSIAANIGSRLISHSSKGSAKSNSHMASPLQHKQDGEQANHGADRQAGDKGFLMRVQPHIRLQD